MDIWIAKQRCFYDFIVYFHFSSFYGSIIGLEGAQIKDIRKSKNLRKKKKKKKESPVKIIFKQLAEKKTTVLWSVYENA